MVRRDGDALPERGAWLLFLRARSRRARVGAGAEARTASVETNTDHGELRTVVDTLRMLSGTVRQAPARDYRASRHFARTARMLEKILVLEAEPDETRTALLDAVDILRDAEVELRELRAELRRRKGTPR